MKFAATSDTHNRLSEIKWPEADVLLHAGDATMGGREREIEQFNRELGETPYKHRIVIAGNHDWLFQKDPAKARAMMTNAIYLEDSGVVLDPDGNAYPWDPEKPAEGIKIWGSPWQPWFYDWAFNLERGDEIRAKWNLIPEGTDILITHGPPKGIGDLTTGLYGPPERVGCWDLMDIICKRKVKFHIFGHIHSAHGIYTDQLGCEKTTFINAAACDEDYDPVQHVRVFEL